MTCWQTALEAPRGLVYWWNRVRSHHSGNDRLRVSRTKSGSIKNAYSFINMDEKTTHQQQYWNKYSIIASYTDRYTHATLRRFRHFRCNSTWTPILDFSSSEYWVKRARYRYMMENVPMAGFYQHFGICSWQTGSLLDDLIKAVHSEWIFVQDKWYAHCTKKLEVWKGRGRLCQHLVSRANPAAIQNG